MLVKVLNAGTKFSATTDKADQKKKKKERRLRRPIICICNDPWGVALRDLRKIATVLTVPPTQSARLASRLKGICTMEQLTADMASLLYLCEKTDNDIRYVICYALVDVSEIRYFDMQRFLENVCSILCQHFNIYNYL